MNTRTRRVLPVRLVAENLDDDDLQNVIQSAARIAVEKVDEVTGGSIFDPFQLENRQPWRGHALRKAGIY